MKEEIVDKLKDVNEFFFVWGREGGVERDDVVVLEIRFGNIWIDPTKRSSIVIRKIF